eukprot:SAG31_NODE_16_length_36206_cov_27.355728_28_plen_64_part_00
MACAHLCLQHSASAITAHSLSLSPCHEQYVEGNVTVVNAYGPARRVGSRNSSERQDTRGNVGL